MDEYVEVPADDVEVQDAPLSSGDAVPEDVASPAAPDTSADVPASDSADASSDGDLTTADPAGESDTAQSDATGHVTVDGVVSVRPAQDVEPVSVVLAPEQWDVVTSYIRYSSCCSLLLVLVASIAVGVQLYHEFAGGWRR